MKKAFFSKKVWQSDISFIPFWKDIKVYRFRSFKDDLFAAISVSLLAIPQSIAYSLLAGLPPSAGLFSAIFGVMITGFFGSCPYFISGPTTGVAILLQSTIVDILSTYYPNVVNEAEILSVTLHILCQIVLIIGILQLIAAFSRLGRLLQFVSRSVILGYFAGVIIAIIVNQAYYFFGIKHGGHEISVILKAWYLFVHLQETNWATVILGCIAISILITLKRFFKRLPDSLFMLIIISVIAFVCNHFFFSSSLKIPTIKDFSLLKAPSFNFILPFFDMKLLNKVFPAALAISLLSILEVFSVSRNLSIQGKKTG